MEVKLAANSGNIFCVEIEVKNSELPCRCKAATRNIFLAATQDKVDLKRDTVMCWCECGYLSILNDVDTIKKTIPNQVRVGASIISPPTAEPVSYSAPERATEQEEETEEEDIEEI